MTQILISLTEEGAMVLMTKYTAILGWWLDCAITQEPELVGRNLLYIMLSGTIFMLSY